MTSVSAQSRWRVELARAAACAVAGLLGAGAAVTSVSAQEKTQEKTQETAQEKVRVTDPYIELRTGPGRGYPVFFVAAREEWIEILVRRTDWFKVRAANGQEGWVHRSQLATTLTTAGTATAFRDTLVDDYLRRKLELGAAWGQFDGEPMLKIWSAYRFADVLSVEGTIGQVQGTYSGTEFWHINLNVEPWSDRRLSPFFGIGLGRFKNIPNASLVSSIETNANLANAAIGLRYYIAERFVAKLDYSIYTAYVSDSDSAEYRAVTLGIAFFF
jgi:SH3-like domain-containing protein